MSIMHVFVCLCLSINLLYFKMLPTRNSYVKLFDCFKINESQQLFFSHTTENSDAKNATMYTAFHKK